MSFIVPGSLIAAALPVAGRSLTASGRIIRMTGPSGPGSESYIVPQVHMSVCPHAVQHIRFAHETRNELCFGLRIDCFGRSLLHYSAHIHHRHPVGQGQSFRLIMGDEYESSANVAMNTSQLLLHDLAELVPIVNQIRTY